MSTNGNGDKRPITLGTIKGWVPIVLLIVAVVTAWVSMRAQISALEKAQIDQGARLSEKMSEVTTRLTAADVELARHFAEVTTTLSARTDAYSLDIVALKVQLARIEADINYIRQEVARNALNPGMPK